MCGHRGRRRLSRMTGQGELVDGGAMEQIAHYRSLREQIERAALPLATSVDGRTFEVQASLHDLALRRGGHVVLEAERGSWLGQITASHSVMADVPGADGSTSSVLVRLAGGHGLVLDGGVPFHDARVRPALPDEVEQWLAGSRPDRAMLVVGELLLAPGVPAALDSGGLNRHTFMCGQSGSGKTYSLGLLLERVLSETELRVVVLDPNSDYVGLGRIREGADPTRAARYAGVPDEVTVWGTGPDAHRALRLRFTELTPAVQAAILGLDPIHDREEYAVLADLLRAAGKGGPLRSGLDELLKSELSSARRLGMRAANLGVLDWEVWAGDQPSLLQELRSPATRCTVVDLGSLETVGEQRLVAEAVLSTLWSQRHTRMPYLVVIDEAHNICAADPTDLVGRLSTERAVQIAAEGRKFGLYLLASTQRPNKVHENVVSQCDNLLLMRMNSDADLADLGRLFSFVPAGLIAGASSFHMGEALVGGKFFPQSGYVRMGARVSEEGGADIPTTWARPRT
jgi:Cdc6-like AAA superfamily ATPase